MQIRLRKIMESPLLMLQKTNLVKTILLQAIDFIHVNGVVRESPLTQMDQNIRAAVDRVLKVSGLPIKCHHAPWRDRGL
jgi:hypothetical protein